MREKDEVEKVMQTMIQSDLEEMSNKEKKKKRAFEDMQVQL